MCSTFFLARLSFCQKEYFSLSEKFFDCLHLDDIAKSSRTRRQERKNYLSDIEKLFDTFSTVIIFAFISQTIRLIGCYWRAREEKLQKADARGAKIALFDLSTWCTSIKSVVELTCECPRWNLWGVEWSDGNDFQWELKK